ncbi:hypothetical protein QJQ45_015001, partial [Haematococcus lacustris]
FAWTIPSIRAGRGETDPPTCHELVGPSSATALLGSMTSAIGKVRRWFSRLASDSSYKQEQLEERVPLGEASMAVEAVQPACQTGAPAECSSTNQPAPESQAQEARAPAKATAVPRAVLDTRDFFAEYGEANRWTILEVIGKGSYGIVCSAQDNFTGERVAIKKITNVFEHVSDATRILREIKLLRLLKHPDIVEIKHIMLPPNSRDFKDIYVVFELLETDLHQVIKANDDLTHQHHQFFLYQMLRGLKYIHSAKVFHRDLKPKNILANADCKLKICDFGLARPAVNDAPTTIFWTDYVATRWYRAPELCGSFFAKYSPAIDVWSVGCIFAEVLLGRPLFPGRNVVHQLEIITDLLGTPPDSVINKASGRAGRQGRAERFKIVLVRNEKARRFLAAMRKKCAAPLEQVFPAADPAALRLLQRLLAFDPADRPTAEQALADPYFADLHSPSREPCAQPISKMAFDFDRRKLVMEDVRSLIYREILEYHPQVLTDYLSRGGQGTFQHPSALDSFKRQFAHLEANPGSALPPRTSPNMNALPRQGEVTANAASNPIPSHPTPAAAASHSYLPHSAGPPPAAALAGAGAGATTLPTWATAAPQHLGSSQTVPGYGKGSSGAAAGAHPSGHTTGVMRASAMPQPMAQQQQQLQPHRNQPHPSHHQTATYPQQQQQQQLVGAGGGAGGGGGVYAAGSSRPVGVDHMVIDQLYDPSAPDRHSTPVPSSHTRPHAVPMTYQQLCQLQQGAVTRAPPSQQQQQQELAMHMAAAAVAASQLAGAGGQAKGGLPGAEAGGPGAGVADGAVPIPMRFLYSQCSAPIPCTAGYGLDSLLAEVRAEQLNQAQAPQNATAATAFGKAGAAQQPALGGPLSNMVGHAMQHSSKAAGGALPVGLPSPATPPQPTPQPTPQSFTGHLLQPTQLSTMAPAGGQQVGHTHYLPGAQQQQQQQVSACLAPSLLPSLSKVFTLVPPGPREVAPGTASCSSGSGSSSSTVSHDTECLSGGGGSSMAIDGRACSSTTSNMTAEVEQVCPSSSMVAIAAVASANQQPYPALLPPAATKVVQMGPGAMGGPGGQLPSGFQAKHAANMGQHAEGCLQPRVQMVGQAAVFMPGYAAGMLPRSESIR